jgi:hypothetical protein
MVCIIYMNNTEINTVDRTTVETTSTQSAVVSHPNRTAIINTLAVAGFIALVAGALWLALNSTRFIPNIVNGIGSAAVYIGSVFVPSPAPANIAVVPTASTTISFGTPVATSTPIVATTTPATTTPATPKPTKPTATGTATGGTYTIVQGTTPTYSGLPDLAVTITAVGYLTNSSTDSFSTSTTVEKGDRPAVKFTIKNIGTNWTGTWRFSIDMPLSRTPVASAQFDTCELLSSGVQRCTSIAQPSIAPGDGWDYKFGFDQVKTGTGQQVTITANFDRTVVDSNVSNNTASAYINVF